MMSQPITTQGYDFLLAKRKKLIEDKAFWTTEKQLAAELGDRSENAEYQAAKENIRTIDRELFKTQGIINNSKIIDTKPTKNKKIVFGDIVELESQEDDSVLKVRIVGTHEINFKDTETQDYLKISNISPLGKHLLGHKVGDEITSMNYDYVIKNKFTMFVE